MQIKVSYINAHATSTWVGDMAKVNATKKVFKDTSSIKMNGTKVKNSLEIRLKLDS